MSLSKFGPTATVMFCFVRPFRMLIDRVSQHVKMHSFDVITTVSERDIGPAHFRTRKHPLSLHGMIRK